MKEEKTGARAVALAVLMDYDREGGFLEAHFKWQAQRAKLDHRERALAMKLCYGVLQNRALCDFYIAAFSSVKPKRMEHYVLNILRLGIYQMVFLDKIPHHAAIHEAVGQARAHVKHPRAAGLVNGILRALSQSIDRLPQVKADGISSLSTRYSHAEWIVKELCLILGAEGTEAVLAKNNTIPPMHAQVNTLQTDSERLMTELEAQGVAAARHSWLPDCLLLSETGNLERLASFQRGDFYIQDAAARLAVLAAGPKPGDRVLDVCAAPGGKSFAAAIAMNDQGEILACDNAGPRIEQIKEGAKRLSLSILKTEQMDARASGKDLADGFDLVIADVPCSGLGVIRKKPEIRYRAPDSLLALSQLQGEILAGAAKAVKPGGALLYSTCTVLPRENEEVVSQFLADHPSYRMDGFSLPGPIGAVTEGQYTLWPHLHDTDGFFIAKLRRQT